MSGAANNAIIRLGRSPFAASRSEAVLLAALSRVGVAKEAGAKQPRWQARKSTASAIRPRPTRNARGESAGSSRARESSARYGPTGAKTKVEPSARTALDQSQEPRRAGGEARGGGGLGASAPILATTAGPAIAWPRN